MEEYELTPEDSAVLFAIIQADRTDGLLPAPTPAFFLDSGQPGSGKTELNKMVSAQHGGNILECNADNLRNYHPEADRILRERELDYPDLTWPAANHWNNQLIELGIERRYNLLIETTLWRAEITLETLRRMKARGYTTNLQVLAVPYRWSWLGIYLRFESLKARAGHARAVSEEAHDSRFKGLQDVLPVIITSRDLDRVAIYRRMPMVDQQATSALELVTERRPEALDTYFAIVGQAMDAQERSRFKSDCAVVLQYMEDRGATPESVAAFKEKADRLTAE